MFVQLAQTNQFKCVKYSTRIICFLLFFYPFNSMWHNKGKHKNQGFVHSIFMNGWFDTRPQSSQHIVYTKHIYNILAYSLNKDVLHYAQWMTKWKHLRTGDIRNKTKIKRNIYKHSILSTSYSSSLWLYNQRTCQICLLSCCNLF